MKQKKTSHLREVWLDEAVTYWLDYMEEKGFLKKGLRRPEVRVSPGLPYGGKKAYLTVAGECYSSAVSDDHKCQIFINPRLSDSYDVLGTLLHELLHSVLGSQIDHGPTFAKAANHLGLIGPAAYHGSVTGELQEKMQNFIATMGPYPHAALRIE
ncbi:SprT-like domain-containing protein [Dictyobacter formicarum]|uniref:SprT-like domain-containing protein n=1 Tax=Dictyobacter formicarum TaxID=2778368 RepID=A0ABQ3VG97_9CHLR|nr:SprT-like domain-containing protein [Dictyobacter formicarum]GHO85187.1 hypothetical protein KSZ_31930 [Dictyobacter formicarum]